MIREIIELGNPILRRQAESVSNFQTPELSPLIQDLLDTMEAAGGVGIAAPQIGISKRVFIVASRPNDRYPNAPLMAPTAMINPVLEWSSEEKAKDWEGCLSIPGLRALVPRPVHIRVRYTDSTTYKEVVAEYKDFIARVWLHEFDHLEGVVFPDRLESSQDLVTHKEYKRILAEQNLVFPP
jgi:peptide deformylase